MTSKERVLAAMRREQPDRVPIHIRGVHAWHADWVAAQHRSYRPLIAAVLEHCDLIPHCWIPGLSTPLLTAATQQITETLSIDAGDWEIRRTILHTPKGNLTQDYWESKHGHLPLTKKCFLQTPEDAQKGLSVPYARPELDLSEYFRLRAEWPDNLVVCDCPQAAEIVHELLGSETFAYWWMDHRHLLFELRDLFQERVLDLVNCLLEAGVGPVVCTNGAEYVAPPIHSPQTYRDFVLPTLREVCQRFHEKGGLVHVHCHNRLNALLEDFVAAGCDVLHPLEPPPMGDIDLGEAKRRVGEHLCLEGNIQIGEIYGSPTERVVRLLTDAIQVAKPGGGFILCPSASPHTPTLSHLTVANYLAMIETGRRLGGY